MMAAKNVRHFMVLAAEASLLHTLQGEIILGLLPIVSAGNQSAQHWLFSADDG
jgi:hypothetical protein